MAGDEFAARLLVWYDHHGRCDLPWQRDPTPYRVWVAEVMLQQTRVETVVPYYERFLDVFPDVRTLAGALLDEVLRLWSGLGYYARARNLHRAAERIVNDHGGRFPENLEAVMALPGIGRSTAGAILAQVFGQRHPILDGNVKRVLCRYHAVEGWPGRRDVEKRLWELADWHTPAERVADYTQAIMDLGATLCARSRPRCEACPQAAGCRARAAGTMLRYPARRPKARRPLQRATLLLVRNGQGAVLLERRPPAGIWGGLWSLPEMPAEAGPGDPAAWCRAELGVDARLERCLPELRHGFTHFELVIAPVLLRAGGGTAPGADRRMEGSGQGWYKPGEKPPGGLPAPVARLLDDLRTIEGGEEQR